MSPPHLVAVDFSTPIKKGRSELRSGWGLRSAKRLRISSEHLKAREAFEAREMRLEAKRVGSPLCDLTAIPRVAFYLAGARRTDPRLLWQRLRRKESNCEFDSNR
jgi:hypothetical protein